MGDIFHPDGRVFQYLGIAFHQLPGHHRHIGGGGIMAGGFGEPAAVFKMSIFQSQPFCFLVHPADKFFLAAGDMFRHGHRSVVAGGHHDAFDQRFHRLLLPLFKVYLGASHAFGVGADGHHFVQGNISRFQFLKNQKQRHDFCNAGGAAGLMGILLVQDRSRGYFHQHRAGRTDGQIRIFPGRLFASGLLLRFLCGVLLRFPGG